MIIIQKDIFFLQQTVEDIKSSNSEIGALVAFTGYVRDFHDTLNDKCSHLEIEHYDGMTQKVLQDIEKSAYSRWNLVETRIIHRVGVIKLNEPIVLIIVASKHRDDAFKACQFIIDYLKTEAPFWKKEVTNNRSLWVEQKESDLVKVK